MSIVTRSAQADMLRDLLRDACTIRLYINEIPEDLEPTAADFVEPQGGGYIGKPIREAGWDLTDAPERAVYPRQVWTFTGPAGTVRGHYVTRNSDGKLRWYEPLSGGPMRIVNDGDQVSVAVTLALGQGGDEEESGEDEDLDEIKETP